MADTVNQDLDQVKWGFEVKGLDPSVRLESDEAGDPIDQLADLMSATGAFRAEPGIRLLAWSEAKKKWYAWVEKPGA
ncbi:MAG: hypothetical protein AAGH88_03410 [Planctomycetota bacterium]